MQNYGNEKAINAMKQLGLEYQSIGDEILMKYIQFLFNSK
jgi:hypothetical protein